MTAPARTFAVCLLLASCSTAGKAGMHRRHPHFDALDANEDGSLSYAEFSRSKWAHDSKNPREVFNRLDTNKNGTISHIELQEYLRRKKGPDPMKLPPRDHPAGPAGAR